MCFLLTKSISGCLKGFLQYAVIKIGYPKIIFNFVLLVKNNFRRLPRRACGTARNDDSGCLKGFLRCYF
ncbi:MAG: hypothetical protein J6W29_06245 [Neisseriaceae bacterium]|nr:hypothetical protein [Neisseriaceae bacterium]